MRKAYSPQFKAQVVRELLKEELTVTHIAVKDGVQLTQLDQWKATVLNGVRTLFVDDHEVLDATTVSRADQLTIRYAEIGKLTMQLRG